MKRIPSAQERAFAAALVADPERNGARAARKAKYSDGKTGACRLLKRPHVKALIRELEAKARKRVKTKKVVVAEVLPPDNRGQPVVNRAQLERIEDRAIGSRAEVLAMCTNLVRTHESRRLGDLYRLTAGPEGGQTLVSDPERIAELPLSSVQELSHDEAGDLKLKLRDPLAAGKILLDDHYRQRGDEDPMERPRQVVNLIMVQGTPKDRRALDDLARRMAGMGPDGSGGNGDA